MKRLVTFLLLSLFFAAASAQTPEQVKVEISQEIANVNGTLFYIHKVQPKQTIYSICQAYGVSQEELAASNSTLREGLKAGSILFIPHKAKSAQFKNSPSEEQRQEEEIPYKEHRVKWYESLRSIAKKYGVSQEEIIAFNNLGEGVIYSRQILKIPLQKIERDENKVEAVEEEVKKAQEKEAEVKVLDIPDMDSREARAKIDLLKRMDHFDRHNPVRVSLILPFASQSVNPSANNLDFYSGALLAVNQMKEEGLNIVLNVIDLTNYSWKGEIFEDGLIEGSHLVVGPIDSASIVPFADYCRKGRIPFVSPLDQKAEAFVTDNPYFFQVPSSSDTQLENLLSQVSAGNGERLTIFYNSAMDEAEYVRKIKTFLDSSFVSYLEFKYGILEGRTIIDRLKREMPGNLKHKVIVASENEAFASDVVRNMELLALSGVDLKVFSSNKVRNFGTIDPEFFHDVNLRSSASYYVDYTDEATNTFVLKYRALFSSEPTPFAFQGYDIMKYFLTVMSEVGPDFAEYTTHYSMSLLQNKIEFYRVSGGGYINKGTRNLEYLKDYIIRVK